jgi:D-tyrosyl-tRNA(Tyr) deacylase
MRAVLQRVSRAVVSWDGGRQEIGLGLLVLLGVGPDDDEAVAGRLAVKVAELRIFEDAEGKTNRSLEEVGGEALVVSQFTLFADTSRGRRPGFYRGGAAGVGRAALPPLRGHPRRSGNDGEDRQLWSRDGRRAGQPRPVHGAARHR